MNLLDWLMANPVALGALFGAGGSVIAQLIGAIVSARSASRRADLDRADRALDRSAAERERFDAARREAFVEILQRSSAIGFTLTNFPTRTELTGIEGDLEELAQRIEIVGLLAPGAYALAVAVHRELARTRERLQFGEPLDDVAAWWAGFRGELVEPMRAAMKAILEPQLEVRKTP